MPLGLWDDPFEGPRMKNRLRTLEIWGENTYIAHSIALTKMEGTGCTYRKTHAKSETISQASVQRRTQW